MNRIRIGTHIKIIRMSGENHYDGREGIITDIDDLGYLHGTWGGLSVIPSEDEIEIIPEGDD